MPTVNPFGFRTAYHPSGTIRSRAFKVLDTAQAAYATALFKGVPVLLDTAGNLKIAAAGGDILGVLDGFEYVDASGKPTKAPNLPASQTGITNVTAFVIDDPDTVFEAVVISGNTLTSAALGDQFTAFDGTYTAASGSTYSGQSTCGLAVTLAGAGVQGLFALVGFGGGALNVLGDATNNPNVVVQVKIARPQLSAVKVAV